MGSNSLATFLSKLLKPDRKDNIPATNKNKVLKRHSAPVPNGFDVTNPAHIPPPAPVKNSQSKSNRRQRAGILEQHQGEEIQNAKTCTDKKNRQDKKQKKNVPKANVQNVPLRKPVDGSDKENGRENQTAGSRGRKTTRRHSTGLAYWFCVSGNPDTLERGMKAPFPQDRKNASELNNSDKIAKKRELASIPEQRQLSDKGGTPGNAPKPVNLAGVIRRDGKKKKGDTKNRHSAPPDTLAVFRAKERPLTPNQYQDYNAHREERSRRRGPDGSEVAPSPTRSMSPGVRYRVDGTLERPYVFPSALTFGAEGRKLQLRSSDVSPVQEVVTNHPRSNLSASTSLVLAEVHSADCEIEKPEKRIGSEPNIADISYDDFDVRKAFYLKYDGCTTQQTQALPPNDTRLYRHSMPMFPANYDVMNAHHNGGLGISEGPTAPAFGADVTHQPQSISPVRQRYSMPPKNDEFVYMGSRENLNVWSEFVDRQGIENNNATVQATAPESLPRKRYSSPVQNGDYVYMGSIENIHLLNVEDKRAGCMSLKRDVDGLFPPANSGIDPDTARPNGDPGIANSSLSDDENQADNTAFTQLTSVYSDKNLPKNSLPVHKQRHQPEEHHHSLPELCSHSDRHLARNVYSESGAIDEDVNMNKENPSTTFNRNPFSRNLGRASCMPGNKKSFAAPPAIFSQSDGTIQLADSNTASDTKAAAMGKFSFLPGNKKFKLPPPPTYTPPREEMEEAQAKLSECHKGSQTDLHDEALYLVNMEDRDLSLNRDQAKTIQSSSFMTESKSLPKDSETDNNGTCSAAVGDPPRTKTEDGDHHKTQTQFQRILNASTSSQGSDDVFKDGSASDSTGQAEGLYPSRRGKYSLPGVRPKFVSEVARDDPSIDAPESKISSVPERSPIPEEPPRQIEQNDDKKESWKTFKAMDIVDAFVTSTPKIARRDKSDEKLDSATAQTRPIPTPRKRYSNIELGSNHAILPRSTTFLVNDFATNSSSTLQTPKHQTSNDFKKDDTASNRPPSLSKSPPVPKKRRNISKSRTDSDSCFSSLEIREETKPRDTFEAKSNPEFYRNQEIPHNFPVHDTADSETTPPLANHIDNSTFNKPENCDLIGQTHKRAAFASSRRHRNGRSLDDTCIADDELSCFEDGGARDTTLKRRRRSMRKCISVDDLLRSGSILDRSMILARKRRRRMRDRKCQSQMLLSSSEAEDTAEMLSARRRAASRERLSSKKDKTAATASSTSRSANGVNIQTSGLAVVDSSMKENAIPSRIIYDNTRGSKFVPTAPEPQRKAPVFTKSPNSNHILSGVRSTNSPELPKTPETGNLDLAGTINRNLRQAPWEVGLLNLGQAQTKAASPPSPSSSFVPRWRSGISTSTPSLAVERPLSSGRETVV